MLLCVNGTIGLMGWKYRKVFLNAQKAMESGQWDESARLLENILSSDPNHAEALLHRAYALFRSSKPQEALADIEKASHLRPDNGVILIFWGEVLMVLRNFSLAEEKLKAGLHLEPDNSRGLVLMAELCKELGRSLDSADFYEKALHFDRDFVMARRLSVG